MVGSTTSQTSTSVGAAKKGWGPNSLTPFVGDANTDTPEFKAFLVNIEPIPGPVA